MTSTFEPTDPTDPADATAIADDDALVLPWWRNPVTLVAILLATAALFAAIGYALGTRHGDVRGNAVDKGFLQDMRYHHENAVVLSRTFLATPAVDDDGAEGSGVVRLIATEIELGQQLEIGRMVQLLRVLGAAEAPDLSQPAMSWMNHTTPYERMPGIATDEQIQQLATSSGPAADELFVALMIAHHEAGIDMAQYALDHGSNGETKAFAESMIVGQQSEIAELRRLGFN